MANEHLVKLVKAFKQLEDLEKTAPLNQEAIKSKLTECNELCRMIPKHEQRRIDRVSLVKLYGVMRELRKRNSSIETEMTIDPRLDELGNKGLEQDSGTKSESCLNVFNDVMQNKYHMSFLLNCASANYAAIGAAGIIIGALALASVMPFFVTGIIPIAIGVAAGLVSFGLYHAAKHNWLDNQQSGLTPADDFRKAVPV